MQKPRLWQAAITSVLTITLGACGGGGGSTTPAGSSTTGTASTTSSTILVAGSTQVLAANASALVPPGTKVVSPNGSTITINGSSNTVYVQANAVVTVPASATGTANNLVTTIASPGAATLSTNVNVSVLAGSATVNYPTMDGAGTAAVLWGGGQIAVEPMTGNLLISDQGLLKRITPAGVVTTLPKPATFGFDGLAFDKDQNLYISTIALNLPVAGVALSNGVSLRKRTPDGTYHDFAINWENFTPPGNEGSGSIASDSAGNLYYADTPNDRIVKFSPSGAMSVLAGSGTAVVSDGVGAAASFANPANIALDANGNIIVADLNAVRKISPDGTVKTLFSGTPVYSVAADRQGNIFFSMPFGSLGRLDPNGNLSTFKIDSTGNFMGGMATDDSGALYIVTRGFGAQVLKATFN